MKVPVDIWLSNVNKDGVRFVVGAEVLGRLVMFNKLGELLRAKVVVSGELVVNPSVMLLGLLGTSDIDPVIFSKELEVVDSWELLVFGTVLEVSGSELVDVWIGDVLTKVEFRTVSFDWRMVELTLATIVPYETKT